MFTEEDACENGWLAVILWIIRHHCVTKIGFDVSYGYMCSYGYSATTAIFDKRRINKFSNPLPVTVPVPSKTYSNEGTAAGSNTF